MLVKGAPDGLIILFDVFAVEQWIPIRCLITEMDE